MDQQHAFAFLVSWLRGEQKHITLYSTYGYDVYLRFVMWDYLKIQEGLHNEESDEMHERLKDISPFFYAAAWDLCRRGIIRPGVKAYRGQTTSEGIAGGGYSITPFGRAWLQEAQYENFVPTEPERFAQMLRPFAQRFGPGFQERAQEAVRCYGAHAYLACCVMCGAATESIVLAIAIAKRDEETVLAAYRTAQGRSRVENMIIGQASKGMQTEFRNYTVLLKYWRDEAAHGRKSDISDNEAFTSLAILLRFAHYAHDHWGDLTV